MKAKRASDLVRSLIVDIDGVIAHQDRPIEERHSAAASAAILFTRLLGGACINLARMAAAAERIADNLEYESEEAPRKDAPDDGRPMADGGTGEAETEADP